MLLTELVAEQNELAKNIVLDDRLPNEIKTIAGVDQSFPDKKLVISAVVVCDYQTFDIVEKTHAIVKTDFPYISGFLSFKEGPAIIEAVSKLKAKPDILLVDGNGILHFRKAGIASYVGIHLDMPTIGVAKSLLCGEVVEPDDDISEIKYMDEVRGYTLKTNKRKIYVSPGHLISLKTSLDVIRQCIEKHSLPEPLRLAHQYANEIKSDFIRSVKPLI